MTVLIISKPLDHHALAVYWGLQQYNAPCHLLSWSDLGQRLKLSMPLGGAMGRNGSLPWVYGQFNAGPLDLESVSTVWIHRNMPIVPHPDVDKADWAAIAKSSEIFRDGAIRRLAKGRFAVNPPEAKWLYDNKIDQLALATEVGFNVPQTLISNDFDRVSAFQAEHGSIVAKPLRFMRWKREDSDIIAYTSPLDPVETYGRQAIEACPMIYQTHVEKEVEYRVVVFGDEIMAYSIDSRVTPGAELDWRAVESTELPIRRATLPEPVNQRIRAFMKASGFVYGSFDLARTPDGEIIFFEINETGQFLWLEQACPETPLLDMFVQFLLARDRTFRYRPGGAPLSFGTWNRDIRDQMLADQEQSHVYVEIDVRFPDKVMN